MPSDSMVPTSFVPGPLKDVKHLKVSLSNPATSSEEGMDSNRCAALHNAIVKYQWEASGYDLAEIPTVTWWQTPRHASYLETMEKVLPDSLVQFLKQALHPEHWPDWSNDFFHHVQCLASPKTMWREVGEEIPDGRESAGDRLALYMVDSEMKFSDETLDGLLYDTRYHACMYNSYDHFSFSQREEDSTLPWQYLETTLTAWIERIERGKAFVLPLSQWNQWPGPADDPAFNIVEHHSNSAWAWRAFTAADVEDTISAWEELVYAINERLPAPYPKPFPVGLFEVSDLIAADLRESSFAWEFYRKACKPQFHFLGPGGLKLPLRDQLVNNPFAAAWESKPKSWPGDVYKPGFPQPILLGQQHVESWWQNYQYEAPSVPWGLYLDVNFQMKSSYEDGSRLVLPELSEDTPARMLDGKKAGTADLYQIGQSPFQPDHPTQLWAMLKFFAVNVSDGKWRVDEDGVSEPSTIFEEQCADPDPDSDEAFNERSDNLQCIYISGCLNGEDS
jgi:hypothetical protein